MCSKWTTPATPPPLSDSHGKHELINERAGIKFCKPISKDKDQRGWLGGIYGKKG